MGKTKRGKANVEHGPKDASSLPSDDGNGRRRSLRKRGIEKEAQKEVSDDKDFAEDKAKPDVASRPKTRHASKESNKVSGQNDRDDEEPANGAQANGTKNDAVKKHHHNHHHHDHHLNEATLQRLRAYLMSDKMQEALDEDAIAVKILRTDRAASERVRFLHDPYADSEEEADDAPNQSYQAAEDYTLALDFYKRVVTETQAETPDKVLDKRTLYWLRKSLGLHRRNELWETTGHEQDQTDESGNDDGSQCKNRRTVTRGMVRSTRIKRREERMTKESMNLNALMSAVEELEDAFGPFSQSPSLVSVIRNPRTTRYVSLAKLVFNIAFFLWCSKRSRPTRRVAGVRRVLPMKIVMIFVGRNRNHHAARGRWREAVLSTVISSLAFLINSYQKVADL